MDQSLRDFALTQLEPALASLAHTHCPDIERPLWWRGSLEAYRHIFRIAHQIEHHGRQERMKARVGLGVLFALFTALLCSSEYRELILAPVGWSGILIAGILVLLSGFWIYQIDIELKECQKKSIPRLAVEMMLIDALAGGMVDRNGLYRAAPSMDQVEHRLRQILIGLTRHTTRIKMW